MVVVKTQMILYKYVETRLIASLPTWSLAYLPLPK
jgi:hypothetical protein